MAGIYNLLAKDGGRFVRGRTVRGAFCSKDRGVTWETINEGFPGSTGVYAFSEFGGHLFAGTYDGVYVLAIGSNSWRRSNKGIPDNSLITSIVATGDPLFARACDTFEGGGYMKYCEVRFSPRGKRPIKFDKPRSGSETEIRQYHALQMALRELPKGEYEKGRHNFYLLEERDTVSVYLIPGFRDGHFVYGGSYRYPFVDGKLVAKQAFHQGYQYVKQLKKMGEVEITSTLNTAPNECDLMKFLVYRNFIPKLRIRTSQYLFFLWEKPEDQVGFDLRVLPESGS